MAKSLSDKLPQAVEIENPQEIDLAKKDFQRKVSNITRDMQLDLGKESIKWSSINQRICA